MFKRFYFIILFLILILFGGYTCDRSSKNFGVYKSEDEGRTWQSKNKIDEKKEISSMEILTVSINREDPNIIYIGTSGNGLFKTIDGGEIWQKKSIGSGKVYSVDIDPKNVNIVYVAGSFNSIGKIYKSSNGGDDFEEIYSETHSDNAVLSLMIDTYDSRKIYAGTSEGLLLKSIDSGRSWILQNKLNSEITAISISSHDTRQVAVGTDSDGVFMTSDGGEKWDSLEESLKSFKKADEVHSLVFDPEIENKIYLGSPAGLLVSDDFGVKWRKLDILTQPEKKSILKIAITYISDIPNIYLGLGTNIYKTMDDGNSWEVNKITDGVIRSVAIDPLNSQTIYVGLGKEENIN